MAGRSTRWTVLEGYSLSLIHICATLATVCYQELPHPISGILQKLSVLDGVEEDRLLVFLDLVLQLADFPGVSDEEVLALILILHVVLRTWTGGVRMPGECTLDCGPGDCRFPLFWKVIMEKVRELESDLRLSRSSVFPVLKVRWRSYVLVFPWS